MGLTEELARFAVETKYNSFPPETVQFTKELCLKTIAGMVSGSEEPVGRKVTNYIKEQGGRPEVGIICSGFRAPVEGAALVHGTFGHASELEDDAQPLGLVSVITMWAVALSLGEKLKLPGKDIITSFINGFEIATRLGVAVFPRYMELGFCCFGSVCAVGTAATACKEMELTTEETTMALSLAASQSCGLVTQVGTMAHLIEAGFGSRIGLLSAMLAREGLNGRPDILETERGLLSILLGGGSFDVAKVTENLGKPPFCVHDVWVKKYPNCGGTHRQIDALMTLVRENNIAYDQIERIDVEVNPGEAAVSNKPDPKDAEDSKFSYSHALAAVLLEGKVDLDTFSDEKITDPKWKEARSKINVIVVPEWGYVITAGITRVTCVLKDGRKLVREQAQPLGGTESPLTTEQIVGLFRQYTQGVLSESDMNRIIDIVLSLEKQRDILELMDILTFRHMV